MPQKRPQNTMSAFNGAIKTSLVRLGGVLKRPWIFVTNPLQCWGKTGLGHFLRPLKAPLRHFTGVFLSHTKTSLSNVLFRFAKKCTQMHLNAPKSVPGCVKAPLGSLW
jgi:hypothetical protein